MSVLYFNSETKIAFRVSREDGTAFTLSNLTLKVINEDRGVVLETLTTTGSPYALEVLRGETSDQEIRVLYKFTVAGVKHLLFHLHADTSEGAAAGPDINTFRRYEVIEVPE